MTPKALETIDVPSDLGECQRMINELVGALKHVLGTVDEQNQQIADLRNRLDVLTRAKYGRSSEVISAGQLRLFESQDSDSETVEVAEPPSVQGPRASRHGRRRPSKELPRRRVVYELAVETRACPGCGKERCPIGEEVSERLAYQPACIEVIEEIRIRYACRDCREHVQLAALPTKPIPKGLADASMLAHIAVSKFADHLPLNRLEGIFRRHGADIARSTMCDWLAATADLVLPIYQRIKERILGSRIIWTDDTPLDVQDRTHENNIREGRIWVYLGDSENNLTVFDFTDSHKRDGPARFLGDFSGFLQADAYAGYDHIYATERVREVACWAHTRRKFFDALNSDKVAASRAIRFIQVIYRIEKRFALRTQSERQHIRQQRTKRVLAMFKKWLDATVLTALPKGPLAKAVKYALNNWDALCTFTEDGELTPDNNKSERALRSIAVGRKNWMFAGSLDGGRRAAILCSLIASCKQHGLNPTAYLTDVLNILCTNEKPDIEALLPDAWAAKIG